MSQLPADDSRVHDYVDGRLHGDERRAFEFQLADSPELRAEVDAFRELRALTLSTPRPEVPVGLAERIAQGVRAETKVTLAPRRMNLRPPAWATAAAVLLLIGLVSWWPNRPSPAHFKADVPRAAWRDDVSGNPAKAADEKGVRLLTVEAIEAKSKNTGGEGAEPLTDAFAKKLDSEKSELAEEKSLPEAPVTPVPTSGNPLPELGAANGVNANSSLHMLTASLSIELVGDEDVIRFSELCRKSGFEPNLALPVQFTGGDRGAPQPMGGAGGGTSSRGSAAERPKAEATRLPRELEDARLKPTDVLREGVMAASKVIEIDIPPSIVAALRDTYGTRLVQLGGPEAKQAPTPTRRGTPGGAGTRPAGRRAATPEVAKSKIQLGSGSPGSGGGAPTDKSDADSRPSGPGSFSAGFPLAEGHTIGPPVRLRVTIRP